MSRYRRAVTSEDLARHIRNEGGEALTLCDLSAAVEHAAGSHDGFERLEEKLSACGATIERISG